MTGRRGWQLGWVGVLALGLVACGPGPSEPEAPGGPAATEAAGVSSGLDGTLQPMIASGSAEAPPTQGAPPVRPTQLGDQRAVGIDEAVAGAGFTVLEPKTLPADTNRDLVHLIRPREGETSEGLPAVRFVYTVGSAGSLVVYQSAATGAPPAGEPIDIGGHAGGVTRDGATVLEWEQDGVRVQLRSGELTEAALVDVAKSMAPVAAPTP